MLPQFQYSFPFMDFTPMSDGTHHAVEICRYHSDVYQEPILFVSDLHKDCAAVVGLLLTFIEPWEWIFVSLGDMAGTDEFGSSGDATDEYKCIHRNFKKFYFVEGYTGPQISDQAISYDFGGVVDARRGDDDDAKAIQSEVQGESRAGGAPR